MQNIVALILTLGAIWLWIITELQNAPDEDDIF
jgi:cytochrome c oxidase assembly factor CtaG